jgi:hypothetical protein
MVRVVRVAYLTSDSKGPTVNEHIVYHKTKGFSGGIEERGYMGGSPNEKRGKPRIINNNECLDELCDTGYSIIDYLIDR